MVEYNGGTAKEAMPEGGNIYIRAENYDNNARDFKLSEGRYLKLELENNGISIKKEHIEKIFNPYFSVKDSGDRKEKGAGLGLAICHSIIAKHGGHIVVH